MTRIAVIDKEKCINGNGCEFQCHKVCPVDRSGTECVTVGDFNKPLINEETCIGCNICVVKCPVDAINIINLPESLNEQPIHRYGENEFALYNLPMPIFG